MPGAKKSAPEVLPLSSQEEVMNLIFSLKDRDKLRKYISQEKDEERREVEAFYKKELHKMRVSHMKELERQEKEYNKLIRQVKQEEADKAEESMNTFKENAKDKITELLDQNIKLKDHLKSAQKGYYKYLELTMSVLGIAKAMKAETKLILESRAEDYKRMAKIEGQISVLDRLNEREGPAMEKLLKVDRNNYDTEISDDVTADDLIGMSPLDTKLIPSVEED